MIQTSEEALRICSRLNASYDGPECVWELLRQLTGTVVDESVTLFPPPFTSDFGRNIRLGKRVFINSGCRFQDQGITIGDDCLTGHNAVIATLQHDIDPARRADLIPFPVVLGQNVWLSANVTVLPGVTIGDDAVIGTGSVVAKDIPARTIAVGSPARVVRTID